MSSYLCCWLLYIDLRRAFHLQVTHKVTFSEGGLRKPLPSVGEGKHSDLNLFPNHCSVLEARLSQKNRETEIPQGEGEKAFSGCEHACEEHASPCGMGAGDERGYLRSAREGLHAEGAGNLPLVPGEEERVHS